MILQPLVEKILHIFWTVAIFFTMNQLVSLFFLYAFLGWLLEIGYRSIRNRRLVNPGVLKGPIVPIYGVGGIIISLTYLLIQTEPLLIRMAIYLISITILEFLTGEALLRIFKKRYWDYSEDPLNFHGHICLTFSTAWALLAVVIEKTSFPLSVWLLHWLSDNIVTTLNRFAFFLVLIDVMYTLNGMKKPKQAFKKLWELMNKLSRIQLAWRLMKIELATLHIRSLQESRKMRHRLRPILKNRSNKNQ